jgi:hypothetical protein
MRPMTTLATIPLANSQPASAAAPGERAAPATSHAKTHVAATPAIAPTARAPTSPASGGNSSE